MYEPRAIKSLIALNKVAAGTHRLEIAPDGSYEARLLNDHDEAQLVTEAAITRASMNAEPAIEDDSARAYNFLERRLRGIEAALRKHYGY